MTDRAPEIAEPKPPMPSTDKALAPAYSAAAPWFRFLAPAILGLAIDLWTKAITFPNGVVRIDGRLAPFQGQYPIPDSAKTLVPEVLVLQTTANQGAVFGIGQGNVKLFVVFSLFALALITWVFVTSRRKQVWLQLSLGLITAGALGNLYDRVMYGAVRDFLQFKVKWYPYIFNIADVLLCVGVPLLMLCWVFAKDPAKEVKAAPA